MPDRMTEILQPSEEGVAAAAALLRRGALVAFGTETVYGLGADAANAPAVAAIFAAKGRPRFNPLICHYPSAADAFAHTVADDRARRLAETFWPGRYAGAARAEHCPVALLAASGLDTWGFGCRVIRSPLRCCGRPRH